MYGLQACAFPVSAANLWNWGAENAELKNTGPELIGPKMQGWKMK